MSLLSILIIVAITAGGVVAGFLFAFSTGVMAALGQQSPEAGAAVMRAINIKVINPVFLTLFVGNAAVTLVVGVMSLFALGSWPSVLALLGSLAYLVGCFGLTMGINVPMNNRLEALKGNPESDAFWAEYLVTWTKWNHVRVVAGALSVALFAAALAV